MKAKLWGTRGSIACAGPTTVRYGGDTASVEIRTRNNDLVIIDAGSGIRSIGQVVDQLDRIDILLSHLHMDHVQGLPFFMPLFDEDVEVHIWGPVSTTSNLRERLSLYLSPPLFPVSIRDLPTVYFHDVSPGEFTLGDLTITADLITHPGATVGYRIEEEGSCLAYLSDHEPALGFEEFPLNPEWTSGYQVALNADVLLHDSQYTDEEYAQKTGWGHTSHSQLVSFAEMTSVGRLVTFHHDPGHDDDMLDEAHAGIAQKLETVELVPGMVGLEIDV